MTQQEFTLPIVGLWFKPPAMKLVKLLPLNTKLELVHEPNNSGIWSPVASS